MSNKECVACGHEVVAWCPHESISDDDLICYNCGLHADSEAAHKVEHLQTERDALAYALQTMGVDPESIIKAYYEHESTGDTP